MPGLGVSEPKKKKRVLGDFAGRTYKPKDALIEQLRTPELKQNEARPKKQGILSEDGKKLAYSKVYDT
jgi:hypothetical protein